MKKIFAFIELTRPINCLMAGIATAIGFAIVAPVASLQMLYAIISVMLICAGGQAINDVFDAHIDAKVSKKKPIPSKRINKGEAFVFALGLFIVGVWIATLLPINAAIVAYVFSALLIIYSSSLAKHKYLGNFVVAGGTAFTLIFGALGAQNLISVNSFEEKLFLVIFLSISAFLANMARELVKDFEDIEKDTGHKHTLPMFKPRLAKNLVLAYTFIAIIIALYAYIEFNLGLPYLTFTLLASILFIHSSSLFNQENYVKSQNNYKKGMLASMIGYASILLK